VRFKFPGKESLVSKPANEHDLETFQYILIAVRALSYLAVGYKTDSTSQK
jgi:hypothetical protein